MAYVDINVVNSVRDKLKSLAGVSPDCCIYIVPENLRLLNEDAYKPLLVSIGPFHYRDQRLAPMQYQKLRYFQSFCRRTSVNLDRYVQVIRQREEEALRYYVETMVLPPKAVLIELLLVDAIFILELFLRSCVDERIDENDRIFNKPRMIVEVTRDIRLEENQVPFFILKDLYDLAFPSSIQSQPHPFLDIAYKFFMGRQRVVPPRIATADIKHLVDFLRLCHLPSVLRGQLSSTKQNFEFTASVTKLSEAGVKFRASQSENLLDLRFVKGVLEIPRLVVTDDTESLFRNMIVFEQCHYYFDSYIIDYIALLNSLITTPKDVDELVHKGIIENWLGSSEEVANMFNNLFKETRLQHGKFYYSSICRDLNAYAGTHWHRWRAILKQQYFNHPWAAISVIYAVVILILTVLQVYTGFKPSSSSSTTTSKSKL